MSYAIIIYDVAIQLPMVCDSTLLEQLKDLFYVSAETAFKSIQVFTSFDFFFLEVHDQFFYCLYVDFFILNELLFFFISILSKKIFDDNKFIVVGNY